MNLHETRGLRERVLDAAAATFAARGYHNATLQEICSDAGLSMSDVTAEFPDTYSVFACTILHASERVLRASDHASGPVADTRQARAQILAVIEATSQVMMGRRSASGFHRAQVRHLTPDDRARNRALLMQIIGRISTPLAVLRPELDDAGRTIVAVAAHSVISSITIHPTNLPEAKMLTLLTSAAMRVVESSPARDADMIEGPEFEYPWQSEDTPRWRIHRAAVHLFAERGFTGTTIDDVATASATTAQTIEHEFGDLAGLLYEGCRIAGDKLVRSNHETLDGGHGPRELLARLVHNYIHHAFGEPDGLTVILTEMRNLQGRQLDEVMAAQAATVGLWVRTLLDVRPELSRPEASFLVFAGLSIVFDVGRVTDWQGGQPAEARILRLVLAALAIAC